ncbi:MAG TPA: hypothetical protein DCG47_02800 [Spirochaetaceae bacterium]|nr:hypothetical protein [Spirochaetaceae bacterium]
MRYCALPRFVAQAPRYAQAQASGNYIFPRGPKQSILKHMDDEGIAYAELVAEAPGIGLYAETGLHDALKRRYASVPGARLEARIGGKVVDVALPHELVEIQTRSLGSIQEKILHLACIMPVRIVHPVIVEKLIHRMDPVSGEELSLRRYRAKKDIYSVFDELVRASLIVASPNVSMDIALVRVREERVRDGSGSWRRKGDRVLSRELDEVISCRSLNGPLDWIGLIPDALPEPYDSASLGEALAIGADRARKPLYTLARAGLLEAAGSSGRRKRYAVARHLRELESVT